MNIYNNFKPTYLYIKQHKTTGLKYFGKTTLSDPIKYHGSGTYWNRHLEKNGYLIETIWIKLFTDKDELVNFALNFSEENKIVESSEWANLKPENGLQGGGVKGIQLKPRTQEHKDNISKSVLETLALKGVVRKEKPIKEPNSQTGRKWNEESRNNHKKWAKNLPKQHACCIHCHKELPIANLYQYHGDKCKFR